MMLPAQPQPSRAKQHWDTANRTHTLIELQHENSKNTAVSTEHYCFLGAEILNRPEASQVQHKYSRAQICLNHVKWKPILTRNSPEQTVSLLSNSVPAKHYQHAMFALHWKLTKLPFRWKWASAECTLITYSLRLLLLVAKLSLKEAAKLSLIETTRQQCKPKIYGG